MAPPTPPEMDGQELQEGIHQLLQHNSGHQAQTEHYPLDNGSYIPGPAVPFTTPEPEQGGWYKDQFGNKNYMYHDQVNLGAELQIVSYDFGKKRNEGNVCLR